MRRITFNKFNMMKVDEQRELLHTLDFAFDASQTVKTDMAFAYNPWKTAYDVMVEAYDTSFKSEETEEIHHGRVPKWYSVLITIGWKSPIIRKVETAIIMPWKFILIY